MSMADLDSDKDKKKEKRKEATLESLLGKEFYKKQLFCHRKINVNCVTILRGVSFIATNYEKKMKGLGAAICK